MNTDDMMAGPPDDHESLNELFREVFELIDLEIESITEDQVEERLLNLLDASGYLCDPRSRPLKTWGSESAHYGLTESQFTEVASSDRMVPVPELRLVCKEIRTARDGAAKILDAARQDAESLKAVAQADTNRIRHKADEYIDAAVLRAAQIIADAQEQAEGIITAARCAEAGYEERIRRQISIPVKSAGGRARVNFIAGNLPDAPTGALSPSPSRARNANTQDTTSADSDAQQVLTEKVHKVAPVALGVAEKVEQVRIGAVNLAALTENGVVETVREGWREGKGGSIVTSNIHITQLASRDREAARLVDRATLAVADGMPLVWAARLQGEPLPERITGCSLVFSLSQAAAEDGRSVFLLGGEPGVPEEAARRLQEQYPDLRIAGTNSPPFGFEKSEAEVDRIVQETASTAPHLVFVGLGFPKQERLIERLREEVPDAWYLGCGSGIAWAAKRRRRAPGFLQDLGLEWAYRLALEPRRLARRYLRHNLLFALGLLVAAIGSRQTSGGCLQATTAGDLQSANATHLTCKNEQ